MGSDYAYVQNPKLRIVLEYVGIIIGTTLIALSFNLFLFPNDVASGGVPGISTLVSALTGLKPAFIQWGLNIPLFLVGFAVFGRQFGVKTLIGTLGVPTVVFFTSGITPATTDPLLAAIFGGIFIGVGLGIVFRSRGSIGGVTIIAQLLFKYFGIPFARAVTMVDAVIVISASVIFGLESAMYALIALFVMGKTIAVIQVGFKQSKMALIVTNAEEQVRATIFKEVDRGVTRLQAQGGYTKEERSVLLVVVDATEFMKLKNVVQKVDPLAFVVVVDSTEVHGRGFGLPKHLSA
ncbi:MAG: YitT family protein [Bacilli bacterium]